MKLFLVVVFLITLQKAVDVDEGVGFWRMMYRKPVVRYGIIPVALLLTVYTCANMYQVSTHKASPPSTKGGNVPTVEAWFNAK